MAMRGEPVTFTGFDTFIVKGIAVAANAKDEKYNNMKQGIAIASMRDITCNREWKKKARPSADLFKEFKLSNLNCLITLDIIE
ncbi:MAG: hypothetical protein A3B66_07920 [Alphaproteobacteria bacterium RIFCSPHIGHO2_02_FULL_46_13]|nr:MAG: hypothetical protein A3B66_07920 [Alphaproteobacteria bacterium RIFCSPHIGHO2_02_FULL_46_13]